MTQQLDRSAPPVVPKSEHLDNLVRVLDLIRAGSARTRPELTRRSGLGRNVVTARVGELLDHGLVEESGLGRSSGGRAPRELRLRADAGVVLVAPLGATGGSAGVTDLAGRLLDHRVVDLDIGTGPEPALGHVEELLDELLGSASVPPGAGVYGIGVGVPGPVEFASGRPVTPPIMPGWDGYDIRGRLARRYQAPVWVDNDVNLLALGELRGGVARGESDLIYIKIGTGIGAGLVFSGQLHRGAQGCAGDIGHVAVVEDTGIICRCDNVGCLESLAGGLALARDGMAAALAGDSPVLARIAWEGRQLTAEDVGRAAQHGDAAAVALIARSGRLVGETLATLVNAFNPSVVVVGGGVAEAGDLLLATVRETVYRRSLPLATRDLRIVQSPVSRDTELLGSAFMVLDELFSPACLRLWLFGRSPAGRPEIAAASGPSRGAHLRTAAGSGYQRGGSHLL
jgi:glucokinase-like ROK family protein